MAELIETSDMGPAQEPQVAVDPDGNVTAVWHQSDGTPNADIWSNRYTPSGGWGVAERINTDDTADATDAQVAVGANGDVIAVWTKYGNVTFGRIWSSRYTPGVGWGVPERIDSELALQVARRTEAATLMISRRV